MSFAGARVLQSLPAQKVSRKHHRLLVLPRRDTSCFLKYIPDTVPLSCVALPGTHDTLVNPMHATK